MRTLLLTMQVFLGFLHTFDYKAWERWLLRQSPNVASVLKYPTEPSSHALSRLAIYCAFTAMNFRLCTTKFQRISFICYDLQTCRNVGLLNPKSEGPTYYKQERPAHQQQALWDESSCHQASTLLYRCPADHRFVEGMRSSKTYLLGLLNETRYHSTTGAYFHWTKLSWPDGFIDDGFIDDLQVSVLESNGSIFLLAMNLTGKAQDFLRSLRD